MSVPTFFAGQRVTEQLIGGKVLPTDRDKAWDLDYSVEAPDFGEKADYIMDGNSTMEEALAKAVIESERKIASVQVGQMIDLTIELVLAMLRNIVVGEKPLTFAAPSGLSLTITMLVNDVPSASLVIFKRKHFAPSSSLANPGSREEVCPISPSDMETRSTSFRLFARSSATTASATRRSESWSADATLLPLLFSLLRPSPPVLLLLSRLLLLLAIRLMNSRAHRSSRQSLPLRVCLSVCVCLCICGTKSESPSRPSVP